MSVQYTAILAQHSWESGTQVYKLTSPDLQTTARITGSKLAALLPLSWRIEAAGVGEPAQWRQLCSKA